MVLNMDRTLTSYLQDRQNLTAKELLEHGNKFVRDAWQSKKTIEYNITVNKGEIVIILKNTIRKPGRIQEHDRLAYSNIRLIKDRTEDTDKKTFFMEVGPKFFNAVRRKNTQKGLDHPRLY